MLTIAALSIAGITLLAACTVSETESSTGAKTTEPSLPPSDVSSPQPSQESAAPARLWQEAIDATSGAGNARLEVQLITNVEGFERITSGEGYVELESGFGDITWTDDLGASREVLTQSGHFLELDGTWFAVEGEAALPTTVAFDPLRGLSSASGVVLTGSEDVLGVETTRYDADLDPADARSIMGFSEEELTVFPDATDASSIATIWVDSEGHIVRLLREYQTTSIDGDPITATSLYLFDAFSAPQPIDVPETADAIPAPV